jgi:hypothetical protein
MGFAPAGRIVAYSAYIQETYLRSQDGRLWVGKFTDVYIW